MNDEMFQQIEAMVQPIIMSNATRFARKLDMTVDDAKQEARIALLLAFQKYDYNDSRGGIFNFAARSVRNYFLKQFYARKAQMRVPHVVYRDGDGQRKVSKMNAESFETISPGDFVALCKRTTLTPEDELQAVDQEARVRELRIRLMNNLGPREKLVFECREDPPSGLLTLMFDECETQPTIPLIAKHLGLSKNAVDWSISKIRRTYVRLVESEDFSDICERAVVRGHWPMIHATEGDSHDFVRKVIEARCLDPKCGEPEIASSENGHRVIERYNWGAALFLSFGGQERTLVVEGRFNETKGTLHSDMGAWKSVEDVVPWYRKLNAEISA